jgi:hypothetical protein
MVRRRRRVPGGWGFSAGRCALRSGAEGRRGVRSGRFEEIASGFGRLTVAGADQCSSPLSREKPASPLGPLSPGPKGSLRPGHVGLLGHMMRHAVRAVTIASFIVGGRQPAGFDVEALVFRPPCPPRARSVRLTCGHCGRSSGSAADRQRCRCRRQRRPPRNR